MMRFRKRCGAGRPGEQPGVPPEGAPPGDTGDAGAGEGREKPRKGKRGGRRCTGWARVAIAPDAMVAGMFEGALENEGIPFVEKKLGLDFPTSPSNQREILVPVEQEEQARNLLEGMWDFEAGGGE